MYAIPIKKFHFFKGISNTNFLIETLSYLTPITGKKNEIIIKENEIIEDIYFVREGRLALEVPINMNNPEESTNKYLSEEFLEFAFEFDYEANYNQLRQFSNIGNSNIMDSDIHGIKKASFFNSFISKIKGTKKYDENNIYLKIHDIHINEDFGDIYMFFGKRSPFALRVKTKRVKLYAIKKINFANLCEEYRNVFRRIHKKKKHNYKIIKNILIKTISKFCDVKGIKIKDVYKPKILKAIKEIQKDHIPIEILKNSKNKNEINEIDEQINKTIKDFDTEIQNRKNSSIYKKNKKTLENLLKLYTKTEENKNKSRENPHHANVKGTMINRINKGFRNSFLENFNVNAPNIYSHTNSIHKKNKFIFQKNKIRRDIKHKRKKSKKRIKVKTIVKTNVASNLNLKGYNFDFSESDESIKTVKINENIENENYQSRGPNTIKILPQSLINLLRTKLNYQQLLNQKVVSNNNEQIFTEIKTNNNIAKKNINISNPYNSQQNSKKSKNLSSSCFAFDNLFNNKNNYKVENEIANLISNSKIEKSSISKKNIKREQ